MKANQYIKLFLASSTATLFLACGGGSSGSAGESKVEFTYPSSGNLVVKVKETKDSDTMDYYNTKISSNIKGNTSEFIFDDAKLHEFKAGNSKMTFSENSDKTINYAFYVNDVLEFEKFNIAVQASQRDRLLLQQAIELRSSDECSAIKESLKNQFLKVKDEVIGDENQTSVMLFYASRTQWWIPKNEAAKEEVQKILTQAIMSMILYYPEYHATIMEYIQKCTEPDLPNGTWKRPDVNFDFVFDIDQNIKQMHANIYNASLCPGWHDAGQQAFGNTHCMYESKLLTWESTTYNKGYNYNTYIYFNDGAESIHKYGESASTSKNRTYSLEIYFHENKVPSSIKVTHLSDGLIFSESYNEDAQLTQACKGSYNNCIRY